jgi:hypothetical protein
MCRIRDRSPRRGPDRGAGPRPRRSDARSGGDPRRHPHALATSVTKAVPRSLGQSSAWSRSSSRRTEVPHPCFPDGLDDRLRRAIAMTDATSDPATLGSPVMPGGKRVAGRYEVRGRLGRGASKDVYLAYDQRLDRSVAPAIVFGVSGSALARLRVERDARVTGRLGDHPNARRSPTGSSPPISPSRRRRRPSARPGCRSRWTGGSSSCRPRTRRIGLRRRPRSPKRSRRCPTTGRQGPRPARPGASPRSSQPEHQSTIRSSRTRCSSVARALWNATPRC